MNAQIKSTLKRAIRDAVKNTKIAPDDSDRDLIGKVFNHFHQSLHGTSLQGYELSKQIPRRIKSFDNYSGEIAIYISKLLGQALLEVKKTKQNGDIKSLQESLFSMRVMANEAERVSKTSEAVLDRLEEIERNIEHG